MTLSLSLLRVYWTLLLNKNISFMVFIKQLKPRIFVQCKCCYRTGALLCKVRFVDSILLSGTGIFFFLSFPPLLFPCFPYTDCTACLTRVYACLWQGPARLSGGPSSIDFNHKHSSGRILGLMVVQLTFNSRSNCFDQKNRKAMAIVLVQEL